MHFYRTIRMDGDLYPAWEATLANAHEEARRFIKDGQDRNEVRIELFDVPTGKEDILTLLNGGSAVDDLGLGAQRTWAITPRGGLKEVPNGE